MSSISKQLSAISCGGRKPSSSSNEIRLVLLGKTGSGKSSTANSILGRKVFETKCGSSSVTKRCRRACGEFRGRHLTILDTPGLLDTHQTPEEVHRELRRSISLLYPGPHVLLLVIQIGRFTQEEKEVVRQLKQAMGFHALSLSVVVFTHGDLLEEGKSVWHCVIDGCSELRQLVDGCGGRYCVFNNHSTKSKEQVSELLALVDSLLQGNRWSYYNSKMMHKAEEDLAQGLQEERRLLDEKEELFKKKLEAIVKESFEKEIEMVQQKSKKEIEELKKKHEKEKEKEERLARDRKEENDKKENERKRQEIIKVMEIRREERERREALQGKLDKVTRMLEEQTQREENTRRAMEEKIHKNEVENEKKDRERELQQLQKEQAIRQREEMKRDDVQKELDKLTQSMEEQSRREEDRKRQMEDLLRCEREESQRERDIQMEKQRAEKRRIIALLQELRLIRIKIEQHRMSEEKLKRQLEEKLRQEREQCQKEISLLKKQRDKECSEMHNETIKRSEERQSMLTTMIGYMQEMGLVALNAAPCCIQ